MQKIIDLLKGLVNLLDKVCTILNFFKDKKKCKDIEKYKEKRTEELFNEKIDCSDDTSKCDAIRKEKQSKIDSMTKTASLVILSLILIGCNTTNKPVSDEEVLSIYDVHNLTTTECTYRIQDDEPILVMDKGEEIRYVFSNEWFIVHKDLLKKHNENQNIIIETLESKDNNWISWIALITVLFLIIFLFITKCKNK